MEGLIKEVFEGVTDKYGIEFGILFLCGVAIACSVFFMIKATSRKKQDTINSKKLDDCLEDREKLRVDVDKAKKEATEAKAEAKDAKRIASDMVAVAKSQESLLKQVLKKSP